MYGNNKSPRHTRTMKCANRETCHYVIKFEYHLFLYKIHIHLTSVRREHIVILADYIPHRCVFDALGIFVNGNEGLIV